MKESVGYTVSLNIMIVFITIVVAFLCAALIYFKSNKAGNVITSAVEKYEGYNSYSISEINRKLYSLGYGSRSIQAKCERESKLSDSMTDSSGNTVNIQCKLTGNSTGRGANGYCIYECIEPSGEYKYYKIRTNLMFSIPIIHEVFDIPIYSNTNRLYIFN